MPTNHCKFKRSPVSHTFLAQVPLDQLTTPTAGLFPEFEHFEVFAGQRPDEPYRWGGWMLEGWWGGDVGGVVGRMRCGGGWQACSP